MNKSFIDIDTADQVSNYLNDICSDPVFLCRNKELCGKDTSIYSSVKNVETICKDIENSNECENDFQECVVLANNTFGESQKYINTSFINIIIPIPNALDSEGNNKFIRLPALSSSKKPNSMEICSVCACMNRFATSPGAGANQYTSPGQNQCVYFDSFEYYYYPVYIENINKKIPDAPPVIIGKYNIINSNIIQIYSEDDLAVTNLYNILLKNGIPSGLSSKFITNVLYKGNNDVKKILQLYLLNKQN